MKKIGYILSNSGIFGKFRMSTVTSEYLRQNSDMHGQVRAYSVMFKYIRVSLNNWSILPRVLLHFQIIESPVLKKIYFEWEYENLFTS